MLENVQNELNKNIKQIAENNLLRKLNKQGLVRNDISNDKFIELLDMEIEILKSDGKKIGTSIGVGIVLTIITGGLF